MPAYTDVIDASGTYEIPPGVTSMSMIEARGRGGDGVAGLINGGNGGGSGAWSNLVNKAVSPGDIWTIAIDDTSSKALAPGSIMADIEAYAAVSQTGGAAASGTGDNKRDGANGGNGGATVGGGGASAASDTTAANAGVDGDSGGTGGATTTGTYTDGGAGGDAPSNNGTTPGGGGAGGNSSGSTSAGTKGGGRVSFTWITGDVPPAAGTGGDMNFPPVMWSPPTPMPY